jgi:hypothetical protein
MLIRLYEEIGRLANGKSMPTFDRRDRGPGFNGMMENCVTSARVMVVYSTVQCYSGIKKRSV